jgi:hypothetical protein
LRYGIISERITNQNILYPIYILQSNLEAPVAVGICIPGRGSCVGSGCIAGIEEIDEIGFTTGSCGVMGTAPAKGFEEMGIVKLPA